MRLTMHTRKAMMMVPKDCNNAGACCMKRPRRHTAESTRYMRTSSARIAKTKPRFAAYFSKWLQPFDAVWMHDVHVQLNHIEGFEKGPHWLSPSHCYLPIMLDFCNTVMTCVPNSATKSIV